MAKQEMALGAADIVADPWRTERPAGIPGRVFRGLVHFGRRKPLGMFGAILVFVPVMASIFLPGLDLGVVELPRIVKYSHDEYVLGQDAMEGMSWDHPMGTDHLGRDLFSRLLYGSRMSFMIGFGVFAIASILSTSLTVVSAYYVKTLDILIQRVVDIIGFLPELILLITLFSIYGAKPVTMILTFTPSGIEKFFEETLERAYDITAAPPDNIEEVGRRYAEAAPRYGMEFFLED